MKLAYFIGFYINTYHTNSTKDIDYIVCILNKIMELESSPSSKNVTSSFYFSINYSPYRVDDCGAIVSAACIVSYI